MSKAIYKIIILTITAIFFTTMIMMQEKNIVAEDNFVPPVVEDIIDEEQVDPEPEPEPMGAKSKTYMDYRMITNTSSNQWALLQTMNICEDGFIRDDDGFIAAALGSYFGPIGSRYVFTLEGGKELKIIKADQKQDRHTCEDNIFGLDNWDIIEFVVDSSKMPKWANGYVYGGNFNNIPEYDGDVISWEKVD